MRSRASAALSSTTSSDDLDSSATAAGDDDDELQATDNASTIAEAVLRMAGKGISGMRVAMDGMGRLFLEVRAEESARCLSCFRTGYTSRRRRNPPRRRVVSSTQSYGWSGMIFSGGR